MTSPVFVNQGFESSRGCPIVAVRGAIYAEELHRKYSSTVVMVFMRAVIQRSCQASVTVDQRLVGKIDRGLVVLLGVAAEDTPADADYLLEKIVGLRIFDDAEGKMNLALADIEGELLVVSQFTLLGDSRKGRRPSFIKAAGPELGRSLYEYFIERAKEQGGNVATGEFGANMQVALVNDGPVTILLDSQKLF